MVTQVEDIVVDIMKLAIPNTMLITHLLGSDDDIPADTTEKNLSIKPFNLETLMDLAKKIYGHHELFDKNRDLFLSAFATEIEEIRKSDEETKKQWENLQERIKGLKERWDHVNDLDVLALRVS